MTTPNSNYLKDSTGEVIKSVSLKVPPNEAEDFIVDAMKKATTVSGMNIKFVDSPAGNLQALFVIQGKVREHAGSNTTPSGTGGIDERDIPYTCRQVMWDDWISNDDVYYNNRMRGTDTEETLVAMMQQGFGNDIQKLLFDGDKSSAHPMLKIMDGFTKKARATLYQTNLIDAEPTIEDFINHAQLLDEKYLDQPDVTWFMNRKTYLKLVGLVQKRPTNLGDTTLVNGKLTEIAGYPIEVVQGMSGGLVILTPKKNFVPVFTRDVEYARTSEGADAVAKKSTYHALFATIDAVILDLEGVAIMTGSKL